VGQARPGFAIGNTGAGLLERSPVPRAGSRFGRRSRIADIVISTCIAISGRSPGSRSRSKANSAARFFWLAATRTSQARRFAFVGNVFRRNIVAGNFIPTNNAGTLSRSQHACICAPNRNQHDPNSGRHQLSRVTRARRFQRIDDGIGKQGSE
jgi:hypothetical protein